MPAAAVDLLKFTVFRRGHDTRKKSAIVFVFTHDVELKDESALLKRLQAANNAAHIGPTVTACQNRHIKNFVSIGTATTD